MPNIRYLNTPQTRIKRFPRKRQQPKQSGASTDWAFLSVASQENMADVALHRYRGYEWNADGGLPAAGGGQGWLLSTGQTGFQGLSDLNTRAMAASLGSILWARWVAAERTLTHKPSKKGLNGSSFYLSKSLCNSFDYFTSPSVIRPVERLFFPIEFLLHTTTWVFRFFFFFPQS